MRLQLDSALSGLSDTGQASSVTAPGPGGAARRSAASGPGDSISISGPSAALARLSDDRVTRVQQLSAAVSSGNYHVPSSAISRAIVAQAGL